MPGPIGEAQSLAAQLFGARRSWFLCNGSRSGPPPPAPLALSDDLVPSRPAQKSRGGPGTYPPNSPRSLPCVVPPVALKRPNTDTSAGMLAAVLACVRLHLARNEGERAGARGPFVLLPRNCHVSGVNAMVLSGNNAVSLPARARPTQSAGHQLRKQTALREEDTLDDSDQSAQLTREPRLLRGDAALRGP